MKRLAIAATLAALLGGAAGAQSPGAPPPSNADPFYAVPMTSVAWRSTEIVGKPVYTRQDQRIGEVDELLVGPDGRILAAVVGVGGFLGIGERKVALAFPALQMTRDARGVKLSVDLNRDMLRAAPEYTMARTN
jgi:PRC-barrel domain